MEESANMNESLFKSLNKNRIIANSLSNHVRLADLGSKKLPLVP